MLLQFQAECAQIITDPHRFPALGNGRGQRRLFTSRQRYKRCRPRREMHAKILAALARHMDLLTMRDGPTRNDRRGSCNAMTEEQLARDAGALFESCSVKDRQEREAHDATGMRAFRSGLRDLEDAGLIKRDQPKTQYCSNCGDTIDPARGKHVCECGGGVRDADGVPEHWRWMSYPTVITLTVAAFEMVGLAEALEDARKYAYDEKQKEKLGPEPIVDVRVERAKRWVVQAQQLAAKRARLDADADARRAKKAQEQLDRLARKLE